MGSSWKTVRPLAEEPQLSEIMADQLASQLQIEDDYVWVDLQEEKTEDTVAHLTSSDSTGVLSNIESKIQTETLEPTESTCSDDDTEYETEPEEMEKFDDWEHKIDNARQATWTKVKLPYPTPQWMKQNEHGTMRIYNSDDKNQKNKVVNPLLPKIQFDAGTTAVLERLIDNRYLGQYNEIIGRGINSLVFHAHCHRKNCMTMPYNNAVKVYRLSGDQDKDKLIFKRVQREYKHLNILYKCNKNRTDTQPIRAWGNVLVMSFIGFESTIAPSIMDLPWDSDKDRSMYLAITSFMNRCHNVMHLVHGKLCAENIRCWFERPHFIGWGHSVTTDHPQALTKLIKDCQFVSEFYSKRGVTVQSTVDLFKEITGCNKLSTKLLEAINTRDLYDRYDQNPNRRSTSPKKPCNNLRFKCN